MSATEQVGRATPCAPAGPWLCEQALASPARTPFFRNPLRIARLVEEASLWRGTPWCADSEARGPRGGVSCHNLPRALYMATGALPPDFPKIAGNPVSTRRADHSVMADWLDARPEFCRVGQASLPVYSDLRPGDLLGFRLYRHVDHLGVLLENGPRGTHFVHVLMHKLTTFDDLNDPTWSSRLLAAWRVVTRPSAVNLDPEADG